MGLTYLGDSRPVFEPAGPRMVYTIPSFVPLEVGDLLLVILVSDETENNAGIAAAGWTLIAADAGTSAHVRVWAHHAGPAEPTSVDVLLGTTTLERVGVMLHFRGGGSIPGVLEAGSFADFAATTTPPIPATISQQANIQFALVTIETSAAIVGFTGWATADTYVSAVLSTRRLVVLYRLVRTGVIAGATGLVGPAASGFAWTAILPARAPFEPGGLVDLVPGNIGLIP